MKNKNTKVVPAEIDGMPPEVAVEILCGNKITNRMRKNCMAVRQKVYPSLAPIINAVDVDGTPIQEYLTDAAISHETKLAKKAKRLTLEQLSSHHHRVTRRRFAVQKLYLKLMQSEASEAHKAALGDELTARAHLLELAQDSLLAEATRRIKIAKSRGQRH